MKNKLLHSILNYINDKLSNKDRHAFEKKVNTDPFLQDAMDGFEQLNANELEHDLKILNHKLEKRTTPPRRILSFYKVAATITILIGIGSIALYVATTTIFENKLAEETKMHQQKKEIQSPEKPQPEKTIEEQPSVKKEQQLTQTKNPKETPTQNKTTEPKAEIISNEEVQKQSRNSVDKEASNENLFDNNEIALAEVDVKAKENEIDNKLAGITPGVQITKSESNAQNTEPTIVFSKTSSTNTLPNNATIEIKGIVLDENNKPLPGANITIENSNQGAISDIDGNFTLQVDSSDNLEFNFIGYSRQTLAVNEIEDQISIQMEPDLLALDEVVVIGYGTQKKSQLTGAVSRIEGHELTGTPPDTDAPAVYRAWAVKIDYQQKHDIQARPIIGWKAYKKYLKANFLLTSDEPTKVIVEFEVTAGGDLNKITVLESPNKQFSDKAHELIVNGAEWTPASKNDKHINQTVTITIKF